MRIDRPHTPTPVTVARRGTGSPLAGIGRVGALAVALGIGSAVVAVPLALADTSGSEGSSAVSGQRGGSAGTASSAIRPSGRGARSGGAGEQPAAVSGGRGPQVSEAATPAVDERTDSRLQASVATESAPEPVAVEPDSAVAVDDVEQPPVAAEPPVMSAAPTVPSVSPGLVKWLGSRDGNSPGAVAWSATRSAISSASSSVTGLPQTPTPGC